MTYILTPILCVSMPILECFRCVLGPPDFMGLPNLIFANMAPRLRDRSLSRVFLPSGSCPALQGVTNLYYDVRCVDDLDIMEITTKVPSLHTLTIIASENGAMHGAARCPMALDLRVLNQRGVDLILRCFENARSVCLTSVMGVGCDPLALTNLLASAAQVTSIDIDWRPVHVELTDAYGHREGGAVAIQLNGKKVAVDLSNEEITDAVRAAWPSLTRDLRTLAVLEELWFVFSERELPVLDVLTIHIFCCEEDDTWSPGTLLDAAPDTPRHKTTCLRLEAFWGRYTVIEADVAKFIRSTFDLQVLRRLVLCGTNFEEELNGLGPLRSLMPHLEIVFECSPERDYYLWSWAFPTSDAIRL
ncbi:hypothetical protein AURDEDRAFT_167187 [Auricularia subglabra TFB-10046 SS5]|nr:hypothetical protein AURDEDRAFT_167187 [Auricularia subglabra TFB-10046 SS5]